METLKEQVKTVTMAEASVRQELTALKGDLDRETTGKSERLARELLAEIEGRGTVYI